MSYDKFARPTQHYNTTTVSVDLSIKHVDFDEASSVFTVYAWFSMVSPAHNGIFNTYIFRIWLNLFWCSTLLHPSFKEWTDDKLKWNESNYGNFSRYGQPNEMITNTIFCVSPIQQRHSKSKLMRSDLLAAHFFVESVWHSMKFGNQILRCTIASITTTTIMVRPIF